MQYILLLAKSVAFQTGKSVPNGEHELSFKLATSGTLLVETIWPGNQHILMVER